MNNFITTDGTRLAYRRTGEGEPLVCLPGGPMQSSAYLGDIAGLSAHRTLIMLDLRGTGDSALPADPATYRVDRQVDDVEAFRDHLGLETMDLLGHSAGGSLAVLYAARHPARVNRIVLLNPSPRAVGVQIADLDRREVAEQRRGEPWFPEAFAAFERVWAGKATGADWEAVSPFIYGRWDGEVRAIRARDDEQQNAEAARAFYAEGAVDPPATRAALAAVDAPVLLVTGEYDVSLPPKRMVEYAGLFRHAEVAIQPGGGHYPWLDDPQWLERTVASWLRSGRAG